MVFLESKNEYQLFTTAEKLTTANKMFAEFHEPDIGNQLTAIACVDDGTFFEKYNIVQ